MAVNKVVYGGNTLIDLTSDTATASDVAQGKKFHLANGVQATGTASGGGGGGGDNIIGAIRGDAELIWSHTEDAMIFEDLGFTKPTYSTSNQALRQSSILTSLSIDLANYSYCAVYRTLVIPEYDIETRAKGREEYFASAVFFELIGTKRGLFKSLDGSTLYNSITGTMASATSSYNLMYWVNATKMLRATTPYGVNVGMANPTYLSDSITIRSLSINMRGNANFFTQTYWDAMTDARVQIFQGIYRSPNTANVKGWGATSQLYHIANCIDNGGDLT